MHGCSASPIDPPGIVRNAEAELEESQLVQGIVNQVVRDNFAVGRYALEWYRRYKRGRTDAALAKLVNDANPDGEISPDYIRYCRKVSSEFRTRVRNLPWVHHREAVSLDKKNARKWLEKAANKEWSVRQLRNAIEMKLTLRGRTRPPQGDKAMKRELRAFFAEVDDLADASRWRAVFEIHGDKVYDRRKDLTSKLKRIKRNAETTLNRIARMSGEPKGKES